MPFISKEEREDFDAKRAELDKLLEQARGLVGSAPVAVSDDPPFDPLTPRYWNGAAFVEHTSDVLTLGASSTHFFGRNGRCVHCGRPPERPGVPGAFGSQCLVHGGTKSDNPRLQQGYTPAVSETSPHPLVGSPMPVVPLPQDKPGYEPPPNLGAIKGFRGVEGSMNLA